MSELESVSRILMPVAIAFLGVILTWIREDIKQIRDSISNVGDRFLAHTTDHQSHCKHPTKGC